MMNKYCTDIPKFHKHKWAYMSIAGHMAHWYNLDCY